VLMILLSISDLAVNSMNTHATPNLVSVVPLSLLCVIQFYMMLQVKDKCSALCGGISLPSVISTLQHAKDSTSRVVSDARNMVAGAARHIAGIGKTGTSTTANRMARYKE